jgi:hypothetical protein
VKWGVAASLSAVTLAITGLAGAASSFTDATGDNNAAPDVRSVNVAESPAGMLEVTVTVGNFAVLPTDSWFNVWFDLDSDQSTGDEGDEALVRYLSDGELQFYRWDGSQLVEQPTAGLTSSFAGGVLSLGIPKAALGETATFGLLTISSRSQPLGDSAVVASDYVPDRGRSAYAGPTPMTFSDLAEDHDGAPDIGAVNVRDAANGWVSFAISTSNHPQLPVDNAVLIRVDRDANPRTGNNGAEIAITTAGGEFAVERWSGEREEWILDDPPTRARVRNAGGVVTLEIHRSELENTPRFGFSVTTLDFNAEAGALLGFDLAPDGGGFYRYALANKPALLLTATRLSAIPAKPRAGKRFTVSLGVRRSDTGRAVTSGAVVCKARVKQKPVPARGAVAGGAGRCSFAIPARSSGSVISGTITVRVGGKSVTEAFSYLIL